jgi:hypothetical protein
MAIASLVLGVLSLPTLGCLGIGAAVAIVLGIVALMRANRDPHLYGGKGFAVGGIVAAALSLLVAVPMAGIVAAIAIPSFLRARVSANESATLGDIRTVISAEAAYTTANEGYYGPMDCLARPSECVPTYTGPPFLDATLASGASKSGYERTFHPGPAAGAGGKGSVSAFAYVAVPVKSGQTGVRGFCGDATGRICFTTDGTAPEVMDGACDPACRELR